MKIAFFTPLAPLKTGIADFSEELLMELKKYFTIDIFVDGYLPTNKDILDNFGIRNIKEFENEKVREEYDEYIYQIGNNDYYHGSIYDMAIKYPGIVELHDIALHHFFIQRTYLKDDIEGYKDIMKYSHGARGEEAVEKFLKNEILPPWDEPLEYMLNKQLIDSTKGFIVHSDFGKQIIKGIKSDAKVIRIYHHTEEFYENYQQEKLRMRGKYGFKEGTVLIASFGYATKSKRIVQIIQALGQLSDKDKRKIKYYIVGEVADDIDIKKLAKESGLENNIIVTGFCELNYMKELMLASDICFSLRYPTQGESSGILHRLLGMGKLVIVTDIGSFSEYPDDVVVKIDLVNEIEQIKQRALEFMHSEKRTVIERNAYQFARQNCLLEQNINFYHDFIKGVDNYFEYDIEEIMADIIFECNIQDSSIIESIINEVVG